VTKSRNQNQILAFGNKLRLLRKKKGLTMTELANLCDIEYRQVSDIELGKISTSLSTIFLLAEVLEISPKELFDF
jgi:transcriptional regulator with XRE-family HTH domain